MPSEWQPHAEGELEMLHEGLDGTYIPGVFNGTKTLPGIPYEDSGPWIFAYPKRASVFQDENITFCYLTNRPKFRVWIYRVGAYDLVSKSALSEIFSPMEWQDVTHRAADNRIRPYNADLDPTTDWQWPSTVDVHIEKSWPPGVYIAMFHAGDVDANGVVTPTIGPDVACTPTYEGCLWSPYKPAAYDATSTWANSAKALFVVRPPVGTSSAKIVVNLSLATFHAYNATGVANMYPAAWGNYTGERKATMLRPGGGTGGWFDTGYGQFDPSLWVSPGAGTGAADNDNECNSFSRWGFKLTSWLEGWLAQTDKGTPTPGTGDAFGASPVDYCTDVDLDQDVGFLSGYHLLLFAGHCEYWSPDMRAHVERFIANGGNVAFLSGDNCPWRIKFVDDDGDGYPDAFVCHKHLSQPLPSGSQVYAGTGMKPYELFGDDSWTVVSALFPYPESAFTGPSARNGGVHSSGQGLGYTVQHADSWVYAGTGLQDGGKLGASISLVHYEVDGVQSEPDPFYASDTVRSKFVRRPTGVDGAPRNFTILGNVFLPIPPDPLSQQWDTFADCNPPMGWSAPAATMGFYTLGACGGTVFNAGTTEWVQALGAASGTSSTLPASDPRTSDVVAVATITANIIEVLSRGPGCRRRLLCVVPRLRYLPLVRPWRWLWPIGSTLIGLAALTYFGRVLEVPTAASVVLAAVGVAAIVLAGALRLVFSRRRMARSARRL